MERKKIIMLVMSILAIVFFVLDYVFVVQKNKVNESNKQTTAQQQEKSDPSNVSANSGIIDVSGGTLISQNNNSFKVKFHIKNEQSYAQAGIKYFVNLNNFDNAVPQKIFFEYPINRETYQDSISIGANSELEKEITYEAPSYLQGKFHLSVAFFQAESGYYLDRIDIGDFNLVKSADFVEIDPGTCYLKVESDKKDDKVFGPLNGVDVSKEEALTAHCKINNYFNQAMTVSPQFTNYYRGDYVGKVVPQEEKSFEQIALNPGETKEVTLAVPRALQPQAYDASLTLMDENGKKVSNSISFHYVLSGQSATIHDIQPDKQGYGKGDVANVSVVWGGAADGFQDSRLGGTPADGLTLEIAVKNSQGESCLDRNGTTALDVAGNSNAQVPLKITKECAHPIFSATIRDKKGEVLDTKEFSPTESLSGKSDNSKIFMIAIGMLFIIALIILVGVLFWKKKIGKGSVSIIIFALFVSGVSIILFFYHVESGSAGNGNEVDLGYGCFQYMDCMNIHCYGGCNGAPTKNDYPSSAAGPNTPLCAWGSPSPASVSFPAGKYGTDSNVTWNCIPYDMGSYAYQHGWYFSGYTQTCQAQRLVPTQIIPSCSINFSPSTLMVGSTGSITTVVTNDADNLMHTTCTFNGVPTTSDLPAGTWNNQVFAVAGTKSCTGTVISSTGDSATCSGSVTSISPPSKPTLVGPAIGNVNTSYNFTASGSIDPEGDNIQYKFDWTNDDTPDQSTGFVLSGTSQTLPYQWAASGSKSLKVEACDTSGSCSPWSDVLTITISDCVAITPLWSDCTESCGNDGAQTRTLTYADCSTELQTQVCNRTACPQWREVIP